MREFKLMPVELDELIEASKHPTLSRERVRRVWEIISKRVGCDPDSVCGGTTSDRYIFHAKPIKV